MKYTAYGELRSGTSTTDYQYTLQKHPGQAGRRNESEIGLYYYVARYYDPALGRFRGLCAPELRALPAPERFLFHGCEREGKSADTIVPEPGSIKAYDRYAHVNGNPVKYNDPSGHTLWEGEGGGGTPHKFLLEYKYKVITTTINLVHLETIYNGVEDMANAMGGSNEFVSNIGGVKISIKELKKNGGLYKLDKITLNSRGFSEWTVVHELAHAWDGANGWELSNDMKSSLDAGFNYPILHFLLPNNSDYWYDPGDGPPPCGVDKLFNAREDFAESVTAYIYPDKAIDSAKERNWPYTNPIFGYSYSTFFDTPRGQFINALFTSYK